MKLSAIESNESQTLYGLELDAVPSNIPDTLREVSIKAEMAGGNMMPEFVTKLVTWNFSASPKNICTIVEFENLTPSEVKNLVLVCSNLQVEMSLLPPKDPTPEAMENYESVLKAATTAMLGFKGGASFIFPICNYIQYMAANVLAGCDALEPKDDYTNSNFKDHMQVEHVDSMKEALKTEVHNFFGGAEVFERSVKLCAKVTSGEIEQGITQG